MGHFCSLPITLWLLALSMHVLALPTDPSDLLVGQGLFGAPSIASFSLDPSHAATFIAWNGSNVLKLEKPAGQEVSYKKGLSYSMAPTRVTHISFKFASSNRDTEDSNLRLMDNNSSTIVLFRAGRGGLVRVNEKQMISFYNDSVSTDYEIKLTQVDLLLDWDHKTIQIFVGGKFKEKCQFFETAAGPASQLLIYNLYSSVSYWSDIVLCQPLCYSFNSGRAIAAVLWGLLIAAFAYL